MSKMFVSRDRFRICNFQCLPWHSMKYRPTSHTECIEDDTWIFVYKHTHSHSFVSTIFYYIYKSMLCISKLYFVVLLFCFISVELRWKKNFTHFEGSVFLFLFFEYMLCIYVPCILNVQRLMFFSRNICLKFALHKRITRYFFNLTLELRTLPSCTLPSFICFIFFFVRRGATNLNEA